jgi:hypothetical protein
MEITTSLLNSWAKQVRDAYLNDSVEPSASVKAIAEEKDLNHKQTQRLCEASNITLKRALRKPEGPDDVQFPLASIADISGSIDDGIDEVEKQASLQREPSFLEKYAEQFFAGHASGEETKVNLTCDKLAMVVEALQRKTIEARKKAHLDEREFEKVANQILNYLADEARATGCVDQSYTALSELMPKHAELIDRLYKFANKVLEVDLMGVYRQPPTLQKNAGWTPNPESEIAKLFEKYASLYADVQDARAEHANLKSYQEHAEDQLRKMIIDGEW